MIPGSMMRFPPPPDTGPAPRMWKSLGVVAQNTAGYVEAHYELKTFSGDLDVDTEAEVRAETGSLLNALTSTQKPIDPDATYMLQRRRGLLRVRLRAGRWNEPTTVSGRM